MAQPSLQASPIGAAVLTMVLLRELGERTYSWVPLYSHFLNWLALNVMLVEKDIT